eukprot:CAMPEP_0168599068 /NCGR_PEP_ID=MMETSP0420-20121227/11832_1 /TAXON_ID=498008 /ORGANISM="Pessonella sp." /LENGTH=144 /DNA_ID=CAMNT_0008636625 /DNA_START=516 /DNA_END=947 /DNA_ORIENTATION=+
MKLNGDQLETDLDAIRAIITEKSKENIFCVMSTTSCFAPRGADDVEAIARLCKELDIPHIVNNAYGIQSSETAKEITRAMRVGRIDAVVSSTDKNFMVPVGGAIIYGQNKQFIESISKSYAGRASGAPCLDLFVTLLHLGENGW